MEDFVTPHLRIMAKLGYEKWPTKVSQILNLYHRAEIQTVRDGIRKAAIIQIDPTNLDETLLKFYREGLIYTPIYKTACLSGYYHIHKEPNPGDRYNWNGCLTKTSEVAQEFKDAYAIHDHLTIGRLLGFPECCINYYIEWFPKNYDPVWVKESGRVRGFPECNMTLRHFGVKMVSHFTCSPKCKKSLELGKKWFKVMKKIDSDLSNDMRQLLSVPIIWSSYHGVAQIESPYFVALVNTFPYMEKPRVIEYVAS